MVSSAAGLRRLWRKGLRAAMRAILVTAPMLRDEGA
jgi:hypothetical protein